MSDVNSVLKCKIWSYHEKLDSIATTNPIHTVKTNDFSQVFDYDTFAYSDFDLILI